VLTDNGIVDLRNLSGDDNLEDDNEGQKAHRMSHSEGLNDVETVLAYGEQQREGTTADVLVQCMDGFRPVK
jgi:hypothetical protein